ATGAGGWGGAPLVRSGGWPPWWPLPPADGVLPLPAARTPEVVAPAAVAAHIRLTVAAVVPATSVIRCFMTRPFRCRRRAAAAPHRLPLRHDQAPAGPRPPPAGPPRPAPSRRGPRAPARFG